MTSSDDPTPTVDELMAELPLRHATSPEWARIAAADLPTFLADHAVCEQQAALFGLSLVGHYPEDADLVVRMSALAAEEVAHLRRVTTLLHKRGLTLQARRPNRWVKGLRLEMEGHSNEWLKVDRLCLGALIEARSCERFTCLLRELGDQDPEVSALLRDLGPAEKRHWRMFHELALREGPTDELTAHWERWLDVEAELSSRGGTRPTVHG